MPAAIALFAKAPRPGRVKTRLSPRLTPEEAAELQQAFVADTWSQLVQPLKITAYLYSDIEWPAYTRLAGAARVGLQRGRDLGSKMLCCFEELQQRGHNRSLIVGSDSPTLPPEYLKRAFELLDDSDAVLGPTEDGGYYAVGCCRPHPGMFQDVIWSDHRTAQQTESAFRRVGFSIRYLPRWYDIDSFQDLQRLAADPRLPERTRAWFAARPAVAAKVGFTSG